MQGPSDPLSNFFNSKIEYNVDGRAVVYNSVEQAFQHLKAKTLSAQRPAADIMRAKSSGSAKYIGSTLNNHPNIDKWNRIEQSTIKQLLQIKLKASKRFRDKLLGTGQATLLHSVKDEKWGIGVETHDICNPLDIKTLKGRNLHGQLLMEMRDNHLSPPITSPSAMPTSNKVEYRPTITTPRPTSARPASVDTSSLHPGKIPPMPNITKPAHKTVHLIGSSILKNIQADRLSHRAQVEKQTAFTIDEAKNIKYQELKSDLVILQVGSNDLKNPSSSVDQVVENMASLVNKISESGSKVAISLTPMQAASHANDTINEKIKVSNATLELRYKNSKIGIFPNNNIDSWCLERDGVHLNRRGASILAGNIRHIINTGMGFTNRQAHNVHTRQHSSEQNHRQSNQYNYNQYN